MAGVEWVLSLNFLKVEMKSGSLSRDKSLMTSATCFWTPLPTVRVLLVIQRSVWLRFLLSAVEGGQIEFDMFVKFHPLLFKRNRSLPSRILGCGRAPGRLAVMWDCFSLLPLGSPGLLLLKDLLSDPFSSTG